MPAIEELSAAAESVVGIQDSKGGQGAGVVIAHICNNSYVLTCHHVVSGYKRVKVIRREGDRRFIATPGTVERMDDKNDVAIVRTSRRLPVPAIQIAEEEPERYEKVFGIGVGSGIFGLAFEGLISARGGSGMQDGKNYVFTGLAVGGMSGGPLIDDDGALVGLIMAVDRNGHLPVWSIGYAVPLPTIKAFLAGAPKFAKSKGKR